MSLIHHDLNLPSRGQQSVAAICPAFADHPGMVVPGNLNELSFHLYLPPHRAWGDVIHAQVRTDPFFMRFEEIDEHLPGRNFKMMGDGPG